MRKIPLSLMIAILTSASGANAGVEFVERQFSITGQLNLNVVPSGGSPELPTFALLFGTARSEQTCNIRRGTDPLTQEWDTTIEEYITGLNPLYDNGGGAQNPLYESATAHFLPSPLHGQYETDPTGRTTARMGGVFALEWSSNGETLSAVGTSELLWTWTATRSFGDESFTAILGSPVALQWSSTELGTALPSITIMQGSTLTFTLVPTPGVTGLFACAGIAALRRRR